MHIEWTWSDMDEAWSLEQFFIINSLKNLEKLSPPCFGLNVSFKLHMLKCNVQCDSIKSLGFVGPLGVIRS